MTGHLDLGERIAHMPGLREEGDEQFSFSVGHRPPPDFIVEISRFGWAWRWEIADHRHGDIIGTTHDIGYALTRARAYRAAKRHVTRERNRVASVERFSA